MKWKLLPALSAALAAPVVGSAAGLPVFEKYVLTDQYFCDGINTGDVNADGRPDILTASKLGSFLFINRAPGP